ncbi:MAG: ORF6N domain-containing protein [Nitrospirae bacterium]|nr:ORF6N domain-containing protein [Nitrospirota bacterium]
MSRKRNDKRNQSRFPAEFMFQLTKEEFDNLVLQFATSSSGKTRQPE